MTRLEVPKRAIGLGFNVAAVPFRANRWAAGIVINHATETYQRLTVGGHQQADAIMLQMPAHNAAVGAETLTKVPIVDRLLVAQSLTVKELLEMNAEPAMVAAAVYLRRKMLHDRKVLRATAYGLIGRSLRQVIRNDIPPEVEASAYPLEVKSMVLETAIENNVVPARLDLPEIDQAVIAIRMDEHKDFM